MKYLKIVDKRCATQDGYGDKTVKEYTVYDDVNILKDEHQNTDNAEYYELKRVYVAVNILNYESGSIDDLGGAGGPGGLGDIGSGGAGEG